MFLLDQDSSKNKKVRELVLTSKKNFLPKKSGQISKIFEVLKNTLNLDIIKVSKFNIW